MIISKFKNKYGRNSQLLKNFVKFMIFILVLCVAVNVLVYRNMRSVMDERLARENYSETKRIADTTESIFREVEFILQYISDNKYIQTYIISPEPEQLIYDINSKVLDEISMFSVIYNYIDSIYIYSEQKDRVFVTDGEKSVQDFPDKNWEEKYAELDGKSAAIWFRKKNDMYPYVYTFMNKISYNGTAGAVIVNINPEKIKSLNTDYDDSMSIYLVSGDGKIIYSGSQTEIYKSADSMPLLKEVLGGTKENYITDNSKSGTAAVAKVKSDYYDVTYISVLELENYKQELVPIWSVLLIIMLFAVLIGFVMAAVFAVSTYKPIEDIIEVLERPESWTEDRKDSGEILYIVSKIISTIQTNEKLAEEFNKQLGVLNRTYAYALQVQINPHFLFNTLNTINLMILDDCGPGQRSSKTLVALSKLLRFGLESDEKFVTVKKEAEYANVYINILKTRYTDLFEVRFGIDEEIKEKRILKLCLQPLIENSVNHGIIEKGSGGMIDIDIHGSEGMLEVSVADNGVGMNTEDLKHLKEYIYSEQEIDGKQIGIKNVRQRIKLLYGEEYDVEITATEGAGMKISFKVPII